jgi:hypothetical protein
MRSSSMVFSICAGLGLCLMAAPVEAQLGYAEPKRFEITPVFGYQWGGAFETNGGGGGFPAGELKLTDSFAWGAILSFLAHAGSAVELIYHRQDTNIEFDPAGAGSNTDLGGFAVNYIQLGGRQQFGHSEQFHPFINGSLGIGILDPKAGDLDSILECRRRRPVHPVERKGGDPHRHQVLVNSGSIRGDRSLVRLLCLRGSRGNRLDRPGSGVGRTGLSLLRVNERNSIAESSPGFIRSG